jgi:phage terminase large subunit-like protein
VPLQIVELPAWHGWRHRSLPARVCKWIEEFVRVPTGYGAGDPLKLSGFQRKIIEQLYESRATVASLPAGNGKTTLLAAIALERICRGDDYVEVDVVATKQDQAGILVETAKRMVEASPALVPLCAFSSNSGTLDYRVTGSRLRAQPAKLSAIQGLNFSLAIIDEIGFAPDEVVSTLIARLGKRPDAALIGIGTPGIEPNVMFRLREQAGDLASVGFSYIEWSAPAGCAVSDRNAWYKANPALRAGFLNADALATQAAILPEHEFRVYHLGQWVTGESASWLPKGAWDACPNVEAPPDGTAVVLGLAGTWSSSIAVVGATMDGALFVAWAAEEATDAELLEVFAAAKDRWEVVEVVVAPRQRSNLIPRLVSAGMTVEVWPNRVDIEVTSSTEWRMAIVQGHVAHDHHPLLAEHVAASVIRPTPDGSLRLASPDDGRSVDAARAARMAWARAAVLSVQLESPAIY